MSRVFRFPATLIWMLASIQVSQPFCLQAEGPKAVASTPASKLSENKESDYYRIVTIAAPPAVNDSRAPVWRPTSKLKVEQASGTKQSTGGEEEANRDEPVSSLDAHGRTFTGLPEDLPLEISGMDWLADGRLAVSIRKGEVWLIDGVLGYDPAHASAKPPRYQQFATGLHEPLGLIRAPNENASLDENANVDVLVTQRSEVTRLTDIDGDSIADQYRTVAKGWGVTGHYHEYAYGPHLDQNGHLWVTLNIGMGLNPDQLARTQHNKALNVRQALWRGWALRIENWDRSPFTSLAQLDPTRRGSRLVPVCAGMRSPCGIGMNREGDLFYSEQQGNWVATGAIHQLREDVLFHHPEALASGEESETPLAKIRSIPGGLPYPEAIAALPELVPPAVWLPYKKMGQSATDIVFDNSGGMFGPFNGQMFVGEFTQAGVNRVFLEKVDGQYQGACFPFRGQLASAVLRLLQSPEGSMLCGLSNRGWSSLGTASYGLQRLVWTGKTPFEIQEMRATPDGFELLFTRPVDSKSASDLASYQLASHTYQYHATYGSDEINQRDLRILGAAVSDDGRTVRLQVEGLRPLYVHSLRADGVRDAEGQKLLHSVAHYTLNRIPNGADSSKIEKPPTDTESLQPPASDTTTPPVAK